MNKLVGAIPNYSCLLFRVLLSRTEEIVVQYPSGKVFAGVGKFKLTCTNGPECTSEIIAY